MSNPLWCWGGNPALSWQLCYCDLIIISRLNIKRGCAYSFHMDICWLKTSYCIQVWCHIFVAPCKEDCDDKCQLSWCPVGQWALKTIQSEADEFTVPGQAHVLSIKPSASGGAKGPGPPLCTMVEAHHGGYRQAGEPRVQGLHSVPW